MAIRFAGKAFLRVNNSYMFLHGNFTVSPSVIERTMIAGQDWVHGFQELPRVPFIEGDISMMPGVRIEDLDGQFDVTITAELANDMTYTLSNAICKAALEENTRDGTCRVRWEGLECIELEGSGVPLGAGHDERFGATAGGGV
jgi:Phage tail tube protein